MQYRIGVIAALVAISGCSSAPKYEYTLYRNSPLDLGMRVQFASFNADESSEYNGGNCRMAARLLNANVAASAKAEGKEPIVGAGFWCEPGPYQAKGSPPSEFESEFPATTGGALSW
jgi:hypothetical protein